MPRLWLRSDRREIGRPAGFIRRSVLFPIWLVIAGYFVYAFAVSLLVWKWDKWTSDSHDLWEFLVLGPVILLVAAAFQRPLIKRVRAWWDGRRGELNVAKLLRPLLKEGYEVLHDLDIGRGNIDHVVIGPTGVFAIETKARRGKLDFRQRRLSINGFRTNYVGQAIAGAMHLRERIGEKIYVVALIAFTKIALPKGPVQLGAVTVLAAEDLAATIRSRSRSLEAAEIPKVRDAIASLTRDPRYQSIETEAATSAPADRRRKTS